MEPREQLSTREGIQLHVTSFTGPGTPVVILHGLAGSSREMLATAEALQPRAVVLIAARGHGGSSRLPTDVSRQAHVDDVVFVIENVLAEPVVLVGQSMGGHTAMLVAAQRPDLIERLVLLEAGVGGDGDSGSREALVSFFASWPQPFPDAATARTFLGDESLAAVWLADLESTDAGLITRFDAETMGATIAHVDESPRWDEWERLAVPTLLVFARDGMFTLEMRDELESRAAAAKRVDLGSGSHDAHLDAFDDWIATLTAFIA